MGRGVAPPDIAAGVADRRRGTRATGLVVSTHAPQYTTNMQFYKVKKRAEKSHRQLPLVSPNPPPSWRKRVHAAAGGSAHRFRFPSPLLSLSFAGSPAAAQFNECFTSIYEALFLQYKVDFVFSGHSACPRYWLLQPILCPRLTHARRGTAVHAYE